MSAKLRLRSGGTLSSREPSGSEVSGMVAPPAPSNNQEGYRLTQLDPRAEDARQISASSEAGRVALAEVFAGTDLLLDEAKINLILGVRAEVLDNWTKARNSFLSIGRALLALDEDVLLSKAEKDRLRRGSERVFPFSEAIASQLRQVARAVRDGRIPEALCPSAYSTAYHLTLLEDDELAEARRLNLMRPDVPRSEVLRFRRSLNERHLVQSDRAARERLFARKAALEAEQNRLKERLENISRELKEIGQTLKQGAQEA